jgi:lysozyme
VARRLFFPALLLLVTGFLAGSYFLGWWIPNFPSENRYPVRGIDVSHHQGEITWASVAATGIKFVYLKASEGEDFQDPSFQRNLAGATGAGLRCGAYHYFTLNTPGLLQAHNFIRAARPGATNLPPVLDLETWGNSSAQPSVSAFQVQLNAAIKELRRAYATEPVIYSSSDFLNSYLKNYPVKRLWYRAVVWTPSLFGFDHWNFWQFTEKARIAGIHGFVDMDVFSGTTGQFENWR